MREFLKKYSYKAVTLFVTQIAISIFGLVLSIACARIGKAMQVTVSCGAVIFYLFLIYASMWELGSKDKFGIEYGKFEEKPLTGLYVSLIANSVNFLLALIITVSLFFADGSFLSAVGAFSSTAAIFIEGMYSGILSLHVGGAPLNSLWFMYFIIPVPALAVSAIAYRLGTKGRHFTNILIPENPEDAEIKRQKKKEKKGEE